MTSPPATGRPARLLGGVWALIVTVLTLLGLLAFGTGTAPAALPEAQTRVGVSAPKTITVVWVSEYIASGQGRGLPVLQGLFVVATGVAANAAVPRFLGNEAGDILDSTRVTIPEGKFGYGRH